MTSLVFAGGKNAILTPAQYAALNFGAFFHFNIFTFNDDNSPTARSAINTFAPSGDMSTAFDQWLDVVQAAGMKYVVPTIKHHDGCCWWASAVQPRNISASSWWAGAGSPDLLAMFYTKTRARNLKFIPYISIWDVAFADAHPGVSNADYLAFTLAILTEIAARCPNITGIWTDGWGWSVGYTVVNYAAVRAKIEQLWPGRLLIENAHEGTTAHTDIIVFEDGADGTPPSDATNKEFATSLYGGDWGWLPTSTISKSAATILNERNANNAKNCSYLLNLAPNRTGSLGSDITAVMAGVS